MNTKKFKQELTDLILKFNESQGATLLDIDLEHSTTWQPSLNKVDVGYDIKIKLG